MKQSKVIAVISGKGGVGKTTSTANIGIGLAKEGLKVVVVDFDIGQRNLDMILGLENKVVFDILNVMEKEVSLTQALIKSKEFYGLSFLAASQTKDKSALNSTDVKTLLDELKELFDIILLDSPAGIESGFEHTIEFADEAIVVVNPEVSSIRDADKAIGIIDSKSQLAKDGTEVKKYLIITRIDSKRVVSGEMLSSEDIVGLLDTKLLGLIPNDTQVIDASNNGKPIILNQDSEAGKAYSRISQRVSGKSVKLIDIENGKRSLLSIIKGFFHV